MRAGVVDLVDTQDLGSCAFGCEGASPSFGTALNLLAPLAVDRARNPLTPAAIGYNHQPAVTRSVGGFRFPARDSGQRQHPWSQRR